MKNKRNIMQFKYHNLLENKNLKIKVRNKFDSQQIYTNMNKQFIERNVIYRVQYFAVS